MSEAAPAVFARARELIAPALQATVERLSPGIRRVVSYHLGWEDADGVASPGDEGKAVRPALAIAAAEAAGGPGASAVPGAVAVELVHNFSLLHDDVMDRDRERRHRATAWSLFGIGPAILAGDALLAIAQELLIEPPEPARLEAAAALSDATGAMITGQAEDLAFETRIGVTVEQCIEMSARKTAALMACACKIGAILGGGDQVIAGRMASFGSSLGLAFQAVDDVLGIWGQPEVTGKAAGSDLRQRKKTLPVTAALAAGGPAAERLGVLLSGDMDTDEDVALAAKLVDENGGRARSLEEAERRLDVALKALREMDVDPDAHRDLEEIARFITARDF
ncbi:MAG: polyprenyl synthetase family protein [Actinomycetota bacterium]